MNDSGLRSAWGCCACIFPREAWIAKHSGFSAGFLARVCRAGSAVNDVSVRSAPRTAWASSGFSSASASARLPVAEDGGSAHAVLVGYRGCGISRSITLRLRGMGSALQVVAGPALFPVVKSPPDITQLVRLQVAPARREAKSATLPTLTLSGFRRFAFMSPSVGLTSAEVKVSFAFQAADMHGRQWLQGCGGSW
jgi:hypothetical protein